MPSAKKVKHAFSITDSSPYLKTRPIILPASSGDISFMPFQHQETEAHLAQVASGSFVYERRVTFIYLIQIKYHVVA